jgi:hypothetical protein
MQKREGLIGQPKLPVWPTLAFGCRARLARQRMLCRFANGDSVFGSNGLRCGLWIFGCLGRLWRLGLRVYCLNCLNRIAHGYHLMRLTLGNWRINFSARMRKVGTNSNDPQGKQRGLLGAFGAADDPAHKVHGLQPVGFGSKMKINCDRLKLVLPAALFPRGVRGKSLLHPAGEVRNNAQDAFDQHQLGPVVHFMLFH